MITEIDLQEAIAECKGKRNPDANTCIKLAAYLIIHKEMYGSDEEKIPQPTYSYATPPVEKITYESDTEFSREIQGMDINDVMRVMDELMSTLQIVNPRLYSGVIRKIRSQNSH